ncbi:S1/P1 nuclease [Bradyrhizobium sp. HKCCYLS1011]|uniref:S1/P1 nuclease n=1 Tax=Bradyrhizobium sp. HKCCYLS1011 TaxID=3420733 RepID=UPI003EBB4102
MMRMTLILSLLCSVLCLHPARVMAWGYQGHEVVGAIADELIKDNANASKQVHDILNSPLPSADEIKDQQDLLPSKSDLKLQQAGPWADCVKSVVHHDGDRFKYELDPNHPEYETPCIPFNSALERARMEDYVKHNWTAPDCTYQPLGFEQGCHNNYHFADVAIQRDSYDRSDLGTSSHDVVSAINAAIAVLTDQTPAPPFKIRDKKEALLLLTHFVGDLHQPLHVGAVYLDAQSGARVDPDAAHAIDPTTETAGGNSIKDENVVLHGEWDDIPFDLGLKATAELMTSARAVPADTTPMDGWAALWATDTLKVAQDAFGGPSFGPKGTDHKWPVSYGSPEKHMAYLHHMDEVKRQQLAKAGAHLAEILNTIWPKN